jgi:hypothetical protein
MTTVFCGVIQCTVYCCFRGTFFLYLHDDDNACGDDDDDEEEDGRTHGCMYVRMRGWAIRYDLCTATFDDLLCFS